jgi:hypothetical protein
VNRRSFLAGAAAAALVAVVPPRRADAIGPLSQLRLAWLDYGGAATSRMSGVTTLAQELKLRTSIDVSLERHAVRLTDDDLFLYPILVMAGDRDYGKLPAREADRLKAWLEAGGFLFVDNGGPSGPSEGFDRAFRAEMERTFPRAPLARIPAEHVLYRDFYRLSYTMGRTNTRPYMEAVTLEGRLAVVYSQNDLLGAYVRDGFGAWEYDVVPGGEPQREMALRTGINIVEYALCLDYKDDQVHLDYLLHKRKWKIDKPKVE